ncbi:hypothetical protein ANN_23128 [Periplaneta americana]|uniref:Uncharacterized protein n=1 Tax=Periplaneta americana TaxID=6978 RepID=A0ABQ8SL88_PERAM|nr:hypothetical protein ANN_23128 [Periplaneta americana]
MSPGSGVQHRKLPSICSYWVEGKPRKKPQPGNLPRPEFEPGPPGFAARRADRYSTYLCINVCMYVRMYNGTISPVVIRARISTFRSTRYERTKLAPAIHWLLVQNSNHRINDAIDKLNEDIDSIVTWTKKFHLNINPRKTQAIILGHKRQTDAVKHLDISPVKVRTIKTEDELLGSYKRSLQFNHLEPLDKFSLWMIAFFRANKIYYRTICSYALKDSQFHDKLHDRLFRIRLHAITFHQFSSPRYTNMILCAFFKIGYL